MKDFKAIQFTPLLFALVLVPRISVANTISLMIPVSGGAQIADNKSSNALSFSGLGFSFGGGGAGSNGAYCTLDIPCSPFLEGDAMGAWTYHGYSGVADISMQFISGPFTISSGCITEPVGCSSAGPFPASFTGTVTSGCCYPLSGTIAGTGMLELGSGVLFPDSYDMYFLTTSMQFSGNADLTIVTPEPRSLVLVGVGMLAIFGVLRWEMWHQRSE